MEKQYTENEKAEIQYGKDRELEDAVKLLQNSGKKDPERKEMLRETYGEFFNGHS